ncbi:MAG: twin-arginine translocation signal domain-containing protein [Actinomycetota bacterium]|nr:twin-arginine translocation signal domain-containing protein [Actinomycetota bacterium]
MTNPTRRTFLTASAAGAAWLALGGCSSSSESSKGRAAPKTAPASRPPRASRLPEPRSAPFDTVVVLMLENRSFDQLLGWVPGANGRQPGLSYPDLERRPVSTYSLGHDFQACGDKDPAHDWQSMVKQYNGGKCDGWLQTQFTGDHFPIGYYEQPQVPILGALATNYTLFDSYHCSLMAATWPNRFYQLCAATDVDETGDSFPSEVADRPSKLDVAIFDRVHDAGLTAGYYHWGEPMTGLFRSARYDDITYPIAKFYDHAKAGTLPNVTFVEPDYTSVSEFLGTSNDYHPHGNIQVGEGYLAQVYESLRHSPQWERMVFVVNFDENGGFYDHVVPPTVKDDNVNPNVAPHPDYRKLGFRVPCIAMGPFAPKKIETAGPYEHCSILKMIEWRWHLEPMTARDANAKNLADALDFSIHRKAVDLPAFTPPPNTQCPKPTVALA